ncbi:hypothetical protein [Methanobrevibacter sp.]|uniref:hypothetical protein n=1 Tax=Methanobrevibacter sp. TaxID=66852 RepID=UPI00388D11A5
MNKKIIVTLIVLLFCVSCLSLVSADNDTNETLQINETLQNNESEKLDMSNYIRPISINGNVIEFSDGFTGFCLDLTKDSITTDDGFTSHATGGDGIQNYVKLAIIEAYKQGCEDNLGQIIASFADGSYKNSDDKVIASVLKSQDTIGDNAVVELEDSIEGTFEFELLKDANGKKSDCLAYKVSLKENDAKLAAAPGDNITGETNDTDNSTSVDNETTNSTAKNTDENTTNETTTNITDNKTDENIANETTTNITDNKTDDSQQNKETLVNVTNKTIINKTNTVVINENNTTTINKNNVKTINKTSDTPKKETIQDRLLKTVGNPIFLLIMVIAIAAIVAVVMRRKE